MRTNYHTFLIHYAFSNSLNADSTDRSCTIRMHLMHTLVLFNQSMVVQTLGNLCGTNLRLSLTVG